jgi:hypothetical protein
MKPQEKAKKYDSKDLQIAFAIGMILGLGIMLLSAFLIK